MAIMKMLNVTTNKHLASSINYILNKSVLTSSYNFVTENYYEEMQETKQIFGKEKDKTDKRGKARQGYHFLFSFSHDESKTLTKDKINELTFEILEQLGISEHYETLTAIHMDKEHAHIHILFNSVSFKNGKKYYYKNKDFKNLMQEKINHVLTENNLSVIPLESSLDAMVYKEWKENKKEDTITIRKLIKFDIAQIVDEVHSLDELLKKLKIEYGYDVKYNRKYATIKHPIANRYIRLNSLKGKFTEEKLTEYFDYKRLGIVIDKIQFTLPKAKIDYSILTKENLTDFQKQQKTQLIEHLKIKNGLQYQNRTYVEKQAILNFQQYAEILYLKIRYNLDSVEKIKDTVAQLEQKIVLEKNEAIKKELFIDYKKIKELEKTEMKGVENEDEIRGIRNTIKR